MKLTKIISGAALIVASSIASQLASAQLLGVVPEAPVFDYNSGGTTTFDANTGVYAINATPTFYSQDGVVDNQIFPLTINPSVTVSILLDSSCGLTSGDPGGDDLTIVGDIDTNLDFVPEFSGTLLTAEVVGFGAGTPNANAVDYDAKFVVTGGELVTAGHYAVGESIGMTITSEGSDFTGDCSVSSSGGAKGEIGLIIDDTPPEKCFDVKKVYVEDAVAYNQCYGWGGGSNRSKFKVKLAAECDVGFDPTNELITLSLDGETVEFTPGAFTQDVDNLSKFRASISGRPSVSAVLDCSEGWFSLIANRADVSQIDFNDGVNVNLTLGAWSKEMHVPLTAIQTYNGYKLVWKYWNPNPADCSNDDYEPPACETNWESVKFKHVESGRIHSFESGIGSTINLVDEYSDNNHATCSAMAAVDSSCTTSVTCGDIIGGFKVLSIEHKNDSQSCDVRDHHGRYNDRWSKKRRRHW